MYKGTFMKRMLLCFTLASLSMHGLGNANSDNTCVGDVVSEGGCHITHKESIDFMGSFRRIETTTDEQWNQLCDKILELQDLVRAYGFSMPVVVTNTEHNKNAYAQYLADESMRTHYYLVDDIAFSVVIIRPDSVKQTEWERGVELLKDIMSCSDVARGFTFSSDTDKSCACGNTD